MVSCNRSFLKDLHLMDKRLGVKFNGRHFVITYDRGCGNQVNLLSVRAEDGSFRQPDNRDLKLLYDGDMSRINPEDYFRRVAFYMDNARKQDRDRNKQNIRDMTKDNKIQLRQHFERVERGGKANSAFRVRSEVRESPPEKLTMDMGSGKLSKTIVQAQE